MLKQISVYLYNNPGELAKFAALLKENEIEIRTLTVAEDDEYGLVLFLVDDSDKCIDLLDKEGHIYSITEVIAVKIKSGVGHTKSLLELSELLGNNGVNIEYLYNAIIKDEASLILKIDNNKKAIDILKKENLLLEE
ncbi:MAG: acetolactate synthase [Candidatus Lokiarchaeota archaeon]|nr:acetolactate synthase [Candidatus Lokiarchaeota archaeon]